MKWWVEVVKQQKAAVDLSIGQSGEGMLSRLGGRLATDAGS
jgi:hypothetical protein